MLLIAKVFAIVGAVVALIGGLFVGEGWIAGGGALIAVALVLAVVRAIAHGREPPTIAEVMDATDGIEDSAPNYSHTEAQAALGDRGAERAKRVG